MTEYEARARELVEDWLDGTTDNFLPHDHKGELILDIKKALKEERTETAKRCADLAWGYTVAHTIRKEFNLDE